MASRRNSQRKFPKQLEVGDLTRIKLLKEIEQLNQKNAESKKKWYQDSQWILALSPILCSIFTLIIAWYSGIFQAQLTLLDFKEQSFNAKKDSVVTSLNRLSSSVDSLKKANLAILNEKSKLKDDRNAILKIIAPNLLKLDSGVKARLEANPEFEKILLTERQTYCDSICEGMTVNMMVVSIKFQKLYKEVVRNLGTPYTYPKRLPKNLREKAKKYLPKV